MKVTSANRIIYRIGSINFTGPNIQRYSTSPPHRRLASYDERLEMLLNSAPKLDEQCDSSKWHKVRHEIHRLILSQPPCDRRKPKSIS